MNPSPQMTMTITPKSSNRSVSIDRFSFTYFPEEHIKLIGVLKYDNVLLSYCAWDIMSLYTLTHMCIVRRNILIVLCTPAVLCLILCMIHTVLLTTVSTIQFFSEL